MDHYAADENYFTEEGIKQGHDDLLHKLEAKKKAHGQRQAARNRRASSSSATGFSARSALVVVLIALASMAGGWMISLFVLS
jgi:uncharacterized membrane protein YgcG